MPPDVTTKIKEAVLHLGDSFETILVVGLIGAVTVILLHLVLTLIGGRSARRRRSSPCCPGSRAQPRSFTR